MLSFIKRGEGKPLLLLHGYLSNKESFTSQIEYFSKYYTVYAPDLSGFGQSTPIDKAYSLDDYVNDLLFFLKDLNLNDFDVIAHSFGARLVLKSDELRKKARKIVITGGAGLKTKKTLKYRVKVIKYKFLKRFFPNGKKILKSGSEEYRSLSPVMKESFVKIVNENLDYKLKDITNEVLLVYGENDKTTPLSLAKKMRKGIKRSSLYVIKQSGHFAFCEKKAEFNAVVREFLLRER